MKKDSNPGILDAIKQAIDVSIKPGDWLPKIGAAWPSPTGVVAMLALIPALAAALGSLMFSSSRVVISNTVWTYSFIGESAWKYAVALGILTYLQWLIGFAIGAAILKALAPKYKASPDASALTMAAAMAPGLVVGVFNIFHSLAFLAGLASLWGLYILYRAQQTLMRPAKGEGTTLFVVSLVLMIIVVAILNWIVGTVFWGSVMWGY